MSTCERLSFFTIKMFLTICFALVVVIVVYALTFISKRQDELSEKSLLESKKDELDVAAKQWKSRVEKSDAEKFTVAGRMEKSRDRTPTIDLPEKTETKRRPQAKRFKGKECKK